MNRRFTKKSSIMGKGGVYECNGCGKRTRETGDGESDFELCRRCLRDSERENSHSDNCHEGPPEGCPLCASEGLTDEWVNA